MVSVIIDSEDMVGFLAPLGLCCFVQTFCSYGAWGLLFVVGHSLYGGTGSVVALRGSRARAQ